MCKQSIQLNAWHYPADKSGKGLSRPGSKALMSTVIVFVCLGNICRSPLAATIFEAKLKKSAPLKECVQVFSAATSFEEVGNPADTRAIRVAVKHSYTAIKEHRSRHISSVCEGLDNNGQKVMFIGMDCSNIANIHRFLDKNPGLRTRASVHLFSEFHVAKDDVLSAEIADPWYHGMAEFEAVLKQCETYATGLLETLQG